MDEAENKTPQEAPQAQAQVVVPATPRKGRWVKGQSGNPAGRPKVVRAVRDLAQKKTTAATNLLINTMEDDKSPLRERIACAKEVLRLAGAYVQQVDVSGTVVQSAADPLQGMDEAAIIAMLLASKGQQPS